MIKTARKCSPLNQPGYGSRSIRIVSLLPGLSDIVSELGQRTQIVGSSHECESPSSILTFPKLPKSAKISAEEVSAGWSFVSSYAPSLGSSLQSQLHKFVCSFYYVDMAKVAEVKPTVILTILPSPRTALDPSLEELTDAIKYAVPSVEEVLSVDPSTISEVFAVSRTVARVLKCPRSADLAAVGAKMRLKSIRRTSLRFATDRPPRVAVLQWADPIFVAGDWIPEIVEIGGGHIGTITHPGGPSSSVSPHKLGEYSIVLFAICGVNLSSCQNICKEFISKHADAFRTESPPRIVATDATKLFSRPTLSTVIQSAEVVSEVVSNSNRYGHREVLWSDFR